MEVYTFLREISSKVNVILRQGIELALYDFTIQHVRHNASATPSRVIAQKQKNRLSNFWAKAW